MPVSAESIEMLFAEQVERPVDPGQAEQIVGLLSPFVDGLNAIEIPLTAQPRTVFVPITALNGVAS